MWSKIKYKILVARSHVLWQLKHFPKRVRRVTDYVFYWLQTEKTVKMMVDKTIIAAPTIDWQMPLFQRPQHLALQLSKLGFDFYYATINHEQDNVHGFKIKNKHLILTNQFNHLVKVVENKWIYLLAGQPLVSVESIQQLKKRGNRVIYDYADEIHDDISGSGKATSTVAQRHKAVKEQGLADLVLCSAQKLYDEMKKYYPEEKLLLCPNAVDYDNFVALSKQPPPGVIQKVLELEKPIIGYYGALANWIDYDYLNNLLCKKPDYQLVLIGIDYDGTLHKKLNFKANNLYYLGIQKYEDLPSLAKHFDVALVPFVRGEIAKSTSPLKFFEYMALELPTVVTKDLVECTKYKTTLVAEDKDDFILKIDKGIGLKNNQKMKEKYRQIAMDNTWEQRARAICNYLESL